MSTYVEVAINLPQIAHTYHYHLPEDLAGSVAPGSLVIVPFGKQRVQGVILRLIEEPEVAETRPVEDLLDEKPALTASQIALAHWLAEETLSPLGACISLMLPPGLSQYTDTLVRLNPKRKLEPEKLSHLEKQIVTLLKERGDLRGRQLDALIRHVEWRGAIRKLASEGVVHTRVVLPPPRVKPKTVRKIALSIPPEAVEHLNESLSRIHRVHDRRMHILKLLAGETKPVEPNWIAKQTGAKKDDFKILEEKGVIKNLNVQIWRDPLEDATYIPAAPPDLTRDQKHAWEQIRAMLSDAQQGRTPKPILLHGVTGSGKTELYLKAVRETLDAGKSAIILVPEISLTPQTVSRFLSRFPGQVGVIHSQLSEGERYDTWRRVRSGELSVIVGPRSALFMPFENLGLIVVDECHHESYDQQDNLPYYHAAETAAAAARLSGAAVIFGSATPRVTQFYKTFSGQWAYLELPRRILAHRETIAHHAQRLGLNLSAIPGEGQTADLELPEVSIVDMRRELRTGNRSVFSRDLQAAVRHVLDTNQQAILFLNRRGTATYVFCRNCGYVVRCPRDNKPLTYHRRENELLCHTCGYRRKIPKKCPDCGSEQIRQLGTGTEKVEQLVRERFPDARTLRWDAETTQKKGAHERILTQFTRQEADILIGTQMLAKGLDLPLVTLVGVILADVGLNLPDYRATERTFQVLTQVAGRAGRSPLGGRVILQTYEPDNYVIQTAAHHDFAGYYEREIAYRRELRYPPFARLVRLEYRHHDARKAEETARQFAEVLSQWIREADQHIVMSGPVPCFFSRLYGRYRWQIVLRGAAPAELLRERPLPDWIVEVDPPSLL